MEDRNASGVVVAAIAFALATAVWLHDAAMSPSSGPAQETLDRVSARVLETQPAEDPSIWRDRVTGMVATITAANAYRDARGRWCRPYIVSLSRRPGGRAVVSHRLACRGVLGTWTPEVAGMISANGGDAVTVGGRTSPQDIGEQLAHSDQ
ncbi:MAG: hypothetical protein M0006_08880 [Magnetospirillum sp.]|nr:hypothetical protein [Magnetospirillum sp.]